jgi:metallo-beta-lactamase family protein
VAQAQACLEQVQGVAYDDDCSRMPACAAASATPATSSARPSSSLDHEAGRTRKLVFSGDLGQPGRPIVRDPTPIDAADVLVVESTYGNRLHRPLGETIDELVQVIEDTLRRRQGNIIIPAFALGRTQELLFLLAGPAPPGPAAAACRCSSIRPWPTR